MTITDRSRERLDDLAERLRAEYGEFEVVEKTWRHPAPFYEDLVERFEDKRAGGAGAWVHDDDGRVLLVRNEGDVGWGDPGGKREAGETFQEAASREIREETGVEIAITGVLELHRIEIYDGTDPDRPHLFEPIVIFVARHESGEPIPEPGEIAEVDWFEDHPPTALYDEVDERPIPFEG